MTSTDSFPNSKVARVIDTYNLSGMGDRLETEWTGIDRERTSLRDLAKQFNCEVLSAAIHETGKRPIENDVVSAYETLTDNNATSADRMRKCRELERAGVDIDSVLNDFVTHQSIHNYLTKHRNAELPDRSEARLERKVETLERLHGRTAVVAESSIETLTSTGNLAEHDYEVLVDIRAVCPDCGTDYAVVDLLHEGGCDCTSS